MIIVAYFANIILNIWLNRWWAHGNFFLIGNTFYLFTQSLVAVPLIFEIPYILKFLKPFRVVALASGFIYNCVYLLSFLDIQYMNYVHATDPDAGPVELFDIMWVLSVLYMLATHFPVVIINLII